MHSSSIRRFLMLAVLSAAFFPSPAARSAQVLPGHVPALAKSLAPVGRLSADREMKLLIGLPLRNPDELKVFLSQLYDPTSPTYRKFQTPEQFGARFGPTVADYEAVCSYLRGNGFRITGTHPNRMLVEIVGSVAQVEKVFRLNMHLYQHPFEPREFFAPDAEPQVDSPVPILDIAGLENSVLPKPANLVQRAAPDRLVTSSPTMWSQNDSHP
jgi:subtilase family serine protease